jgi:hypothetical protein
LPDPVRIRERQFGSSGTRPDRDAIGITFFPVVQTSQGTVSLSSSSMLPLLILFVLVATDLWVYLDAKVRAQRGTPVVFTLGNFEVHTPTQWFIGCLLLWIVAFPLYLAGRSR